jgi:hypothetical protein
MLALDGVQFLPRYPLWLEMMLPRQVYDVTQASLFFTACRDEQLKKMSPVRL